MATWKERCDAAEVEARNVDPSARLYCIENDDGDGPDESSVEICALDVRGMETMMLRGYANNPEGALSDFRRAIRECGAACQSWQPA